MTFNLCQLKSSDTNAFGYYNSVSENGSNYNYISSKVTNSLGGFEHTSVVFLFLEFLLGSIIQISRPNFLCLFKKDANSGSLELNYTGVLLVLLLAIFNILLSLIAFPLSGKLSLFISSLFGLLNTLLSLADIYENCKTNNWVYLLYGVCIFLLASAISLVFFFKGEEFIKQMVMFGFLFAALIAVLIVDYNLDISFKEMFGKVKK